MAEPTPKQAISVKVGLTPAERGLGLLGDNRVDKAVAFKDIPTRGWS